MDVTVATPPEKHDLSLTAVVMSRRFGEGDDAVAGNAKLSNAFSPRISDILHQRSPGYITSPASR